MREIIFLVLLIVGTSAFAQNDTLTSKDLERELAPLKSSIQLLQSENNTLTKEISRLSLKLYSANAIIDSLAKQIVTNSNAIQETSTELGLNISNTAENANKRIESVNESLSSVNDSVSKNYIYGIIGVALAILISCIVYFLLWRRQNTDKSNIIEQLSKTKISIEESLVKVFDKQTELMDTHIQQLTKQNSESTDKPDIEPDHSLALKLASEINLIERNLSLMDTETRGLKQLKRSVGKLKDNLAANGYEMPELLGRKFNQGMNVIVITSIPDENLEKDSEIISKILIPQVNYNDKMIQTAQIEVSVGV